MSANAPRRTVDLIDRRVGLLFGVFVLLLVFAAGRAAYLGTFRSGALKAAAAEEHIQTVTTPAVRGEITDRSGVVLALSETDDEVLADPLLTGSLKHLDRLAGALAPLVGLSATKTFSDLTQPHSQYLVLNTDVSSAVAKKITALGMNGINLEPIEKRVYPLGDEAAQVLGWVPTRTKPENGAGLEYLFNKELHGVSGTSQVVRDAKGQPIQVTTTRRMDPGQTVQTTLSAPLQAEVEQVLQGVAQQFKPVSASAIVADPQTDQLLAVANWPQFNPNDITSADTQGTVPADEDQAVDFTYEPGSTFKAITVAGALQDGVVNPDTEFDIPSELPTPADGKFITDAENHGDETLSVKQILQVSSNIGAVKIGLALGQDRFAQWVHEFGFGRQTGVALPGEGQGVVKPADKYVPFDMYNFPFGQGQSVTPMQMVQAYDAIADGGVLREPQLIESVGGKKVSAPKGKRIISSTVADELRNMLRGVVTDAGTASGAEINGFDLAGKTGTAQVSVNGHYAAHKWIASFIGMVPASDPKLVVDVVVNEPAEGEYGGSVAAPAFRKIALFAVRYFGINPCPVAVAGVCSGQ